MFERVNNPHELLQYKLGSAYQMEQDVLRMLGNLEDKSERDELKQYFRQHARETEQQIQNIEGAFRAIGEEPDDTSCPVTKALEAEARANIKRTADGLVDNVILGAADETEHFEIAMYENLITLAEEQGHAEAANLLQQNLAQEERMLEGVRNAARQVAATAA